MKHRFFLRVGVVVMACAVVALRLGAATDMLPNVPGLQIGEAGNFRFDGLAFSMIHFDENWESAVQDQGWSDSGYPVKTGAEWKTVGAMPVKAGTPTLRFTEKVDAFSPGKVRVGYEVTHPTGLPTQELAVQVTLPIALCAGRAVIIDGKSVPLPEKFQGSDLFHDWANAPHTLHLPSETGTIEIAGRFALVVLDGRQWKQDSFTVRLRFPGGNVLTRSALEFEAGFVASRCDAVSLLAAANRGFRDDVAGDGRGGWTDQGPDNDLRAFPPGRLVAAGVTFDIVDASKNDGRGAVVLGGANGQTMPESATVAVPGGPVWRNLYLLHAAGWPPATGATVGVVRVRYAGGGEQSFEVKEGRDVGNWWSPATLPNGAVGWEGDNANSHVGLYVSRFPLEPKPVEAVTLEASKTSLWMVAGITGSPDDIVPRRPAMPWVAKAGREWAPYRHSLEIAPGGVFDFSFLADAPAGKYGAVIATPEGHLAFANRPEKRVRLAGVNLCFSANYLTHEEADGLAARLAASGYNAVRLHHYDGMLAKAGGRSGELDASQLDKLDYLFSALKRRGIYMDIDLFTIRGFGAAECAELGIDPGANVPSQFKALVPISDAAFSAWSRFARSLMTHKNPYTGLAWAEDPALFGICPLNEDTLVVTVNTTPALRKRYEDAFAPWWMDAGNRARAGGDEAAGFNLFLADKEIAADGRAHAFLRSLGVKALLTGANFLNAPALAFVRGRYDYVDDHEYWDHPQFPARPWELPFAFGQRDAVRFAAQVPRDLMGARVWGRPFVVSEFNYVKPNQYRAEGGALMPAYASLQDWDGLFNFDYAAIRGSALSGGVDGPFSLADDPIGLLADRVGALIFRRGDIGSAHRAVGYAVQSPGAFRHMEWGKGFPNAFSELGLVARIGSGTGLPAEERARHKLDAVATAADTAGDAGAGVYAATDGLAQKLEADGVLPKGSVDGAGSRFVSDTGQVRLDAKASTLAVVAPRCELFVLAEGAELSGDRVSVKNGGGFGTVSVVSVDGKPLSESARLLVLHLTDALPTGMRFADADRRLLEAKGHLPFLVRDGEADIRLRLDPAAGWRAWAVDASGKRVREVPLARDGDGWVLRARTVTREGTQLAYEIARQ